MSCSKGAAQHLYGTLSNAFVVPSTIDQFIVFDVETSDTI